MDVIAGFFMGLLALVLPGLAPPVPYHGYIEADYLYIAPEGAGRITDLQVVEGEGVAKGQVLFVLDDNAQRASLRAAEAREAVAEANWQNLKTGSRAAEVDVIQASLRQAEADLALARLTLERDLKLAEKGFASTAQIDGDNAKLATATAHVAQLNAQLQVAALPARDAQLVAAEKSFEAAKADSDRARSDFEGRTVSSLQDARIERTYFRVGEVVGTGVPVMSLLPPGALKARFFVPEGARSGLQIGAALRVTCDGCEGPVAATLTYMASDPQHTPPIIYSREERARLVFMVEGRLEGDAGLLPGQPISVEVAQ